LNNLLATFYIKPAAVDQEGSIEFAHKSFGEFLFAERLKEAIEDWSKPGERRRGQYLVPDDQLQWEIYDLLGFGGLTPEITSYLMVMLEDSQEWQPIVLFERLNDFWERWCDGEFIDAPPENLPQKKMRSLREQMPDHETKLGLRQVDIYTGLNVLILLLSLHRYAQTQDTLKDKIHFYPSGNPTEHSRPLRLLNVSYYSNCVDIGGFRTIVGFALPCADLRRADLRSADLRSADLRRADLSSADLSSADLRRADLSSADLSSADLSSADLRSADLRSADLRSADLRGADLSSADLSSADLSSANLSSADLRSANLSSADLSSADLSNANLSSADLSSADLSSADLSSAGLSSANLRRANLSSADLSSADLSSAYLRSANLRRADLRSANLDDANLENVRWDQNINWEGVKGLETARNLPEALKQQLGLT
jgi:uncharacterized protein YjbI with pentapeptide repeats